MASSKHTENVGFFTLTIRKYLIFRKHPIRKYLIFRKHPHDFTNTEEQILTANGGQKHKYIFFCVKIFSNKTRNMCFYCTSKRDFSSPI